jgi:hypothetical protein
MAVEDEDGDMEQVAAELEPRKYRSYLLRRFLRKSVESARDEITVCGGYITAVEPKLCLRYKEKRRIFIARNAEDGIKLKKKKRG